MVWVHRGPAFAKALVSLFSLLRILKSSPQLSNIQDIFCLRSPKHRDCSQLTVKSDEDNWLQPLILLSIKFWGSYVVIAYYQTDQYQAQKYSIMQLNQVILSTNVQSGWEILLPRECCSSGKQQGRRRLRT